MARHKQGVDPGTATKTTAKTNVEPQQFNADDLDDRKIRGIQRFKAAERSNGNAILLNDTTTLWMSSRGNRAWKVKREQKNQRGKLTISYECTCGDWDKNGRIDCQHVFAERLRRGEAVVVGTVEPRRVRRAVTSRRPARKRIAASGLAMSTVQRHARVQLSARIPELLRDLARAMERE
jgi:hypothetical protein